LTGHFTFHHLISSPQMKQTPPFFVKKTPFTVKE
jgi:hypothetical protein